MTNREMVIERLAKMSDEELEAWYTDMDENKKYESICDYCQKKYGACNIDDLKMCRVTSQEWLDSEAVPKGE